MATPAHSGDLSAPASSASDWKPWGLVNPLTITLFLFVANILLAVTPTYAGARNPADNLPRLYVTLADFDGGWVGSAATAALRAANSADRGKLPTLTVVDAATTSPAALRDAVINGDSWAAVWVAPNAPLR